MAASPAARARARRLQTEQIAASVAALESEPGFRAWMRARRRFHTYSLRNQLLICLQRPDATRVAGMRAWGALGYRIAKGSKAIWILAPMTVTFTNEAGDEDKRTHFRSVKVFDHADTVPIPGAEQLPVHEPTGFDWPPESGSDPYTPLAAAALAAFPELTIEREAPTTSSAYGAYRPSVKQIVVRPDLEPEAAARVLLHELGHHLCRPATQSVGGGEAHPPLKLTYDEEELVVEAAAQIANDFYGLPAHEGSDRYLRHYNNDAGAQRLLELAGHIDQIATSLETLLPDTPQAKEAA